MRSSPVVKELRKIVGAEAVLDQPEDLMLYEYDAGLSTGTPQWVVFPETTEQVSQIVRLASRMNVPLVPRGAGTGLSGGSIPRAGGIVLVCSRMTRILEIDAANRRAVVQPGVVNADLSAVVAQHGLCRRSPISSSSRSRMRRATSTAPSSSPTTRWTSPEAAIRRPPEGRGESDSLICRMQAVCS